MDFAPEGFVHGCCVNAAWPLGDVRRQGLREIWDGDRARSLRAAVQRGDLGYGCGNCRHRLEHGTGFADVEYYRWMSEPADPDWPEVMAFGLSNTCNLACVMCGGNLSSRLRAIEGRPRLEPAYGDRFFAELEDFLPHVRRTEFRGGEPFLIREHHRVWDLLADLGLCPEVQVTTNGTLWDERVHRVLDRFPTQITFSLDGLDPTVNSAIRVGSDHATVLANAERFAAYTRAVGTRFDLSFCLLRQNWRELADLVRFADELGAEAHAQIVLERDHGLHRLPSSELAEVVTELTRQGEDLDVSAPNRTLWDRMVGWLDAELRQRQHGLPARIWEAPGPDNIDHAVTRRRRATADAATGPSVEPARAALAGWSTTGVAGDLVSGPDGRIREVTVDGVFPPEVALPDLVGATDLEALGRLAEAFGPHTWIVDEFESPGLVEQTLFFAPSPLRDKTGLVVRLVSVPTADGGIRTLVAADTCFWPAPQPVALTAR